MGGGRWDDDRYTSSKSARVASKTPDFAYSHSNPTMVHESLDPKRINKKPFGKLESRDSDEHPESLPVFLDFDVTGSNIRNAEEAQKKLPNLMNLLTKYVKDPQVAIAANDDFHVEPEKCVQISDFESDNRVDEHIRNIILVNNGGGNDGESYDLVMYAAARKTVLDCMEKRQKKGYFFMYADEPIFPEVEKSEVKAVFGDTLQADIPVAEIIEDLRKLYHVYVIWPGGSQHGYEHSRKQYVKLFGEESVLTLQHPNLICEMVGSVVGFNEGLIMAPADLKRDLLEAGSSAHEAEEVTTALAPFIGRADGSKSGKLASSGKAGASRL